MLRPVVVFPSVEVDVDCALSWKSVVENILGSGLMKSIYCHVWPREEKVSKYRWKLLLY